MDTTETYIKMCKQAKKYLPVQIPEVGNYWVFGRGGLSKPELVCEGESWESPLLRPWAAYCHDKDEYDALISNSFPVFRQDQLQEMVEASSVGDLLERFLEWEDSPYFLNRRREVFTSMEQLWLAFAMEEKFNRTWSGEDWEMSDLALPLDKFKAN